MPILQNPRHEAFAQELAKGKTADEAYKAAGYKPSRFNASRLKTNDNICARLAELQGQAAERAVVTTESLIAEADSLMRLAIEKAQFSPAVSALTLKAKLAGLLDRPQSSLTHTVPTRPFVDAPPRETWEEWLERERLDGHGARRREVDPETLPTIG